MEIARKNCLVLIAKNLKKGLTPGQIEAGLQILIGYRNVINVYFPRVEGGMHIGVANVELLNAPVYKKFVKKTHKLHNKYVRFNPHPIDGSAAPLEETFKELGFQDMNTALASTVEAIENTTAPSKQKGIAKAEISTLMKEAIVEGNQQLKQELQADMQTMREDILTESYTYTNIMTEDLRTKIDGQFDNIDNQFKALMESLTSTRRLLNDTPQRKALPPPNSSHSN
jgi:hypothetical protein